MANIMFASPIKDLQKAVKKGDLGDLNPTPWAFMLGNCLGWVTYGILLQNLWIFFGNAPGFIISVWLNLGAVKLLYQKHHSEELKENMVNLLVDQERNMSLRYSLNSSATLAIREYEAETKEGGPDGSSLDKNETVHMHADIDKDATPKSAAEWGKILLDVTSQRTPAPAPHEKIVFAMTVMWVTCISIICLVPSITQRNRELIVASLVISNLVFFYGAPLSTIHTVLKDRNSSSIHVPTMITNTLNGTFWSIYGFAVSDMFIAIPNGLGALFGGIQIVLCVLFRGEANNSEKDAIQSSDGIGITFPLKLKEEI
jgi:solute carrier family 50 protein (sugar transporter)